MKPTLLLALKPTPKIVALSMTLLSMSTLPACGLALVPLMKKKTPDPIRSSPPKTTSTGSSSPSGSSSSPTYTTPTYTSPYTSPTYTAPTTTYTGGYTSGGTTYTSGSSSSGSSSSGSTDSGSTSSSPSWDEVPKEELAAFNKAKAYIDSILDEQKNKKIQTLVSQNGSKISIKNVYSNLRYSLDSFQINNYFSGTADRQQIINIAAFLKLLETNKLPFIYKVDFELDFDATTSGYSGFSVSVPLKDSNETVNFYAATDTIENVFSKFHNLMSLKALEDVANGVAASAFKIAPKLSVAQVKNLKTLLLDKETKQIYFPDNAQLSPLDLAKVVPFVDYAMAAEALPNGLNPTLSASSIYFFNLVKDLKTNFKFESLKNREGITLPVFSLQIDLADFIKAKNYEDVFTTVFKIKPSEVWTVRGNLALESNGFAKFNEKWNHFYQTTFDSTISPNDSKIKENPQWSMSLASDLTHNYSVLRTQRIKSVFDKLTPTDNFIDNWTAISGNPDRTEWSFSLNSPMNLSVQKHLRKNISTVRFNNQTLSVNVVLNSNSELPKFNLSQTIDNAKGTPKLNKFVSFQYHRGLGLQIVDPAELAKFENLTDSLLGLTIEHSLNLAIEALSWTTHKISTDFASRTFNQTESARFGGLEFQVDISALNAFLVALADQNKGSPNFEVIFATESNKLVQNFVNNKLPKFIEAVDRGEIDGSKATKLVLSATALDPNAPDSFKDSNEDGVIRLNMANPELTLSK